MMFCSIPGRSYGIEERVGRASRAAGASAMKSGNGNFSEATGMGKVAVSDHVIDGTGNACRLQQRHGANWPHRGSRSLISSAP